MAKTTARMGAKRSVGMIRVLRDTMTAVGPNRSMLYLLVAFSIAAGLVESVLLFLVARLALGSAESVDEVDVGFGPIPDLVVPMNNALLLAVGFLVASVVLGYPVAKLTGLLSRRTLIRLRTETLRSYLRSPWSLRASDPEGHLQELMSEYCQRVERVVSFGTLIIVGAVSIITIVVAALFIAPVGSGVLMVGLFILAAALRPVTKRVKRGSALMARTNKGLSSQVAQTSRVAQEIAAFDVADAVVAWLRAPIARAGVLVGRVRFASQLMPTLYQAGALALVLGVTALLTTSPSSSITNLAPVLLLFVRALGYGRQIQSQTQRGVEMSPYVETLEEEIDRLLSATPPVPDRAVETFDAVVFRDVVFEYQPGRPVLRDLNLRIERGTAVGVVGPSGAGKSTLMQLLLRLRPPTSGSILLNDIPIAEIAPADWASLISFVPQDNKLIRGTVAENICFYRDGFTADDVERAARAAHLHDEIVAFPDGYDTLIGPDARDLSGGQRQRLGIARAVIGRPAFLVLDEPTSALDDRSERLVRQTLQEITSWTTLVIIAHRPGILEVCDQIVRVDHGRVAVEVRSPVDEEEVTADVGVGGGQ